MHLTNTQSKQIIEWQLAVSFKSNATPVVIVLSSYYLTN